MPDLEVKNIYYFGPDGSYTHMAMNRFMEDNNVKYTDLIPLKTIKNILKTVDSDKNSLGIFPIENSIEGIVREAIDNLIKVKDNDLKIIGEIILPISHCLMSKSNDINTVKTVISHPQALAQCSDYISRMPNEIHILEETSTSAAAKRVSVLDNTYAAIANEVAAEIFNLNILDTSVNDEKDNKTRFLIIGRNKTNSTGDDKTSIAFATKNVSGALCKVLNVFDKHGINLVYIDSRPSKKFLGEYNFFIDFDGHIEDLNIKNAINEMKPLINFYRCNGSFKKYKK